MTKIALYGIIVVGIVAAVTGTLYYTYETGYDNGHAIAEKEARELTDRAISKLAQDADRADLAYGLCIDSGGVWKFENNQCSRTSAE